MIVRPVVMLASVVLLAVVSLPRAHAQDVLGIEICTVEKTMERRTSCLQSNVNFLQATIGKLGRDSQQKLDAANRQIDALKASLVALQKTVDELQAAQKAKVTTPSKDATPSRDAATKDAPAVPAKGAAK